MTCDNGIDYGGSRPDSSRTRGRCRVRIPVTTTVRSEAVAGMRRFERGKGASFRRRLRSTAATAPYRGKEGIHRSYHTVSGRSEHGEPPDRQIPSLSMVQPRECNVRKSTASAKAPLPPILFVSALPLRATTQCGTRHCTINAICLEGRKSGSWRVESFLSDGWLEMVGGWNDDIGLRGACYNGVQDVSSRSRRPAHDVQLYQAC